MSIKIFFKKFWHEWKILFRDKAYIISFLLGFCVLIGSLFMTYFVSLYNDFESYESVGDSILDNLPTYNLEFLFVWGLSVIIFLAAYFLIFYKPELIPFTLKTLGLLFMVRCGFIILTHVGPPEGFFYYTHPQNYSPILSKLVFRNDLFFSAHTGIPFMFYLLLKGERFRWVMLFSSVLMAFTVLVMHVHYSIDVFAAFFITHGIYSLSDRVFNKLNLRFSKRINLYGWITLQKRFNTYRDRRKERLVEKEKVYDEVAVR